VELLVFYLLVSEAFRSFHKKSVLNLGQLRVHLSCDRMLVAISGHNLTKACNPVS
jgi:hypothetical protein